MAQDPQLGPGKIRLAFFDRWVGYEGRRPKWVRAHVLYAHPNWRYLSPSQQSLLLNLVFQAADTRNLTPYDLDLLEGVFGHAVHLQDLVALYRWGWISFQGDLPQDLLQETSKVPQDLLQDAIDTLARLLEIPPKRKTTPKSNGELFLENCNDLQNDP